jgi:replication-associated recombination protein RarA
MAFALAEEIGGEIHHIPSRTCDLETVQSVCEKCHYFPWAGKWHFVIVDEADQMSRPAQLAFLSRLDSTNPPPNTIFFFTANDTALLEKRFTSRTRILRFDLEPETSAAAAYLDRVWRAETDAAAPDFAAMLLESGYNLRDALMRLELEMVAPGMGSQPKRAAVVEIPTRPSYRHADAGPAAYHCPKCSAPSANRQGVHAHMRLVHHFEKPERDRLIAGASA